MNARNRQKAVPDPGKDEARTVSEPISDRDVREMVTRAQAGDHEAFESLYRKYVNRVYALCLRLTTDAREAERLTQDAFVQAWQKMGSFRGEAAFSTWLHRLAVNTVWQERRAGKRRRDRIMLTDDTAALSGSVEPRASETAIDLERAITTLPERARMVFVLHEIEGYRHEEIAEMMETSVGTSKAQLHRARSLLRKALEQ